MDNLTHSLVGLAAAKAGLEKLSPHATFCSIVAANVPDSDIVVLLFGDRWTFLEHHRGITHSIVGTLVLGLLLPLVFYVLEGLLARVRGRQGTIRLKGLILVSVIVSATHPLLDWTNNYGIRPLLPFSAQWYYGDFVFIIDPFMWILFGGACFLLTSGAKWQALFWFLLAAVLSFLVVVMPVRRGFEANTVLRAFWIFSMIALLVLFKLGVDERWGRKIAVVAIVAVTLYGISLATLHVFAVREGWDHARIIATQNGESVTDVAAMPTLANPFHWLCVVETESAAYRFELSLIDGHNASVNLVRHERADNSASPAVERASQDRRAEIFLGFARFPVARVLGADCLSETLVQFADLRYTQPGTTRGSFALELPVECPVTASE